MSALTIGVNIQGGYHSKALLNLSNATRLDNVNAEILTIESQY